MVDVILDLGSDVIQKDESDDVTVILNREREREVRRDVNHSIDLNKISRIESESVKIESRKRK